MDDQTKEYIESAIRLSVCAARTDRADLIDTIIPDMLDGEGADDADSQAWALGLLDAIWAERLADSRTWPRPTDIHRLQAAFDDLAGKGFICYGIERSAVTQSDVHDDIAEIYHDAGGSASSYRAYLGCHEQDIERALMEGGGLYLMFGTITKSGMSGDEATGHTAVEAMRDAGLTVIWDGSVDTRILLEGFKWQKTLPES